MRNQQCEPPMSLDECAVTVLRSSIDKIERKQGAIVIQDPVVREIIGTVEEFIRDKKLVCYGGTAINNILPKRDQFYDKKVQLPDYDFFSPNALADAKELADIFHKKDLPEIVARAGVHHGTYKVQVTFMSVADVTQLDERLFKSLRRAAIVVDGISYCPPDYLRMSMYLELSRPDGDVSRWEKILKRLILLNRHFPIKGERCNGEDIQRLFGGQDAETKKLFHVLRTTFAKQKVVFFGALATSMYARQDSNIKDPPTVPDFDVLSMNPGKTAGNVAADLRSAGFKSVTVHSHEKIGDIVASHYEIRVGSETVAFVYEPLACHGYNVVKIGPLSLRIASIDTMMSFYLAFIYADKPYYDVNRILCMCEALAKIQQKTKYSQKGILRRFDVPCYGSQMTLEDIQREKTDKYHELKGTNRTDFDKWFLRYEPGNTRAKQSHKRAHGTKRKSGQQRNKTTRKKKPLFLGLF